MRVSACIPDIVRTTRSCASPRRWWTIGGRPWRSPPSRKFQDQTMDFALTNEQRHWQMTARKFAEDEIRPISLARDAIDDPHETFDWDIIKKGSKLGFRTLAVPREYG